jgi:NAD(P)-dependent dehydrogenase (short-subunit alcohol dehydrogenase family)
LLARQGAAVIALDCNLEAARETATIIREEGGAAIAVQAVVSDEASMKEALALGCEALGDIDIYVANAGIGKLGGVSETSVGDLERIQQVNVQSLLIGARLLAPVMCGRGGGAIVTIASVAGTRYVGYPHLAYSVTKAAVIHFTRMLAQEFAQQGVRANCVIPGLIDTPRIQKNVARAYSSSGSLDTMRSERNAQVPMRRMGTAWEVAQAVAFLASDEASYITGTELLVDGGLTGKFA